MSRVAVIGAETAIQGFGLVGALMLVATDPDEVRAAWRSVPPDVGVVILTHDAAASIGPVALDRDWPLVAVMT